ncbi:syncollin [Caloenas nicobarica]|uniref:syncollin n=1 Tax=Caloenas nicobarica TaxID=187106 RepID=UPI0032B86B6D
MAALATVTVMLVAALAALGGAGAQCPTPASLRPSDGSVVCAQLYSDNSAYYDQCCAGDVLLVSPDDDVPYMPLNWINRVSSLVVATKCKLTVWSLPGKLGKSRTFSAVAVPRLQEYSKGLLGNWNDAISGYYCKCS